MNREYLMGFLVSRSKEKSTWIGVITATVGMMNLNIAPGDVQTLAGVLAAMAGIAAAFIPEQ